MNQPQKITNQASKSTLINLEKGLIPPQAIDLEESVLGCALTYQSSIGEIVALFREEKVFYKEQNQLVYDAMCELFRDSEPVDLLTVSTKLKQHGNLEKAGGDYRLIELSQSSVTTAHLEMHCRLLLQYWVKRKAIGVANEIIEKSYKEETDIFDLLADCQKDIDDTAQWLVRKPAASLKSVLDSFFDNVDNKISGVPSALTKLQKKTKGYHGSDLVIVAGRPGMGKTAFILNEAYHQAKQGIPVGIFSLEMSAKQLLGRIIANHCEIDASIIKNNDLNDFQKRLVQQHRHEIEKLPIYINDQAGISNMELKIQAGKWKRDHGIKIIYVDYLQLMTASGKNHTGNREQEISAISRSLKGTAKDLDVPVIALSQLSRAVETRGGMKRPMLSDLRESGAIEQDADQVMFVYRPEYYKIEEWDNDERTPTHGQCEINIEKLRGGEPGACIVGVKLNYMRFHNLEDQWEPLPPPPPIQSPEDAFGPVEDNTMPDGDDDMPF
ncbi:replicative DNA helicase [Aestuariibaculum marinum]|uniref:Replicative DNA helicase n=1 Tax=Aestuariibaculum marinum TaxID=2683592 RepID=A0A8J6Q6R4_9FLAO|nr:replicative DNA helicase [Aestuariibaculum marinum]MBD0822621.1 replicative DNA helicase [Aestuariibaculum marinum]